MPYSWLDSLWGDSPPPSPPRHPSSRGAFLGMNYQAMPDMTAPIEDQRGNIPDTLPPLQGEAAENAEVLSRYPPGSHVYTKEAYDWLQKNMPDDPRRRRLEIRLTLVPASLTAATLWTLAAGRRSRLRRPVYASVSWHDSPI